VSQTANGASTSYTQDLAAGQSQVLASTSGGSTTDYLVDANGSLLANLAGGVRTWYGLDGQGSVRQLLTDSGSVTGTQNYDPYGQVEAGSTLSSSFGYTGQLQDSTTGAEYLRARWYQPSNAQLLGVDPALASTGQPYAYANDNPVNGSDPSGNCSVPGSTVNLAGIEGSGPCDPTILADLEGKGSQAAGAVQGQQAAFTSALNEELAAGQAHLAAGQPYTDAIVLNPGQCGTRNVCAEDRSTALGAVEELEAQLADPNAVVNRSNRTGSLKASGVCLGATGVETPTRPGTGGGIDIGVIIIGAVVIVAVVVVAAIVLYRHLKPNPTVVVPPTPQPPAATAPPEPEPAIWRAISIGTGQEQYN
jgi:RHS repeat-associated protein